MGKFISTFTAFFGFVLVFITLTSQVIHSQDVTSLKEMIESHYKAINTGEDRLKTCGLRPITTTLNNKYKNEVTMISRTIIIALAGILTVGLNDCLSQDLQPGQVLQNLEEEQKLSRLQVNINAMTIALIKYAKENGNSVSDAGLWTGKFFARSWGENLTPEGFVRGMNNNWQMFDGKTEIIEATSDRIQGKRDMLMSKTEFQELFSNYGVTQSEFQTFFREVQKGITGAFGLTYSEEIDGDSILFTVAAGDN